ncbi:hypothetical protein H4R18_001108 [Coemansia javaensis]|uniref:PH domain-containing protein n=1 Tax=Coemansia javaensis TaxID=2761396 RepID=A0A9W8LM32_9FUNG|nr:hypothetical protein H4R18_001108 [Coemansia javaensis]
MYSQSSASCAPTAWPSRSSAVSRSLKRRSLQPHQPVSKGDIRRVPADEPGHAARRAFAPAQSTGSGDDDDVCYQRLGAWVHAVENYQEFFRSMAAAELDLATVYARIGDILKVPLREDALLLPADGDGAQGVARRLKGFQQLMVENHCAISRAAKHGALDALGALHAEAVELRDSYAAAMRPLHAQLAQCKDSVARRTLLLQAAIGAACEASERAREVAKDPFIINLEVEALLRRHAEAENRLFAESTAQQARIRAFEPRLVARLAEAVSQYMGVVSDRHKRLRLAAKRDVRALARVDGAAEWAHFGWAFADALAEPQGTTGLAKAQDFEYPGKDSEWVRVLRQGVVALKEHGPMFRSTWQSKYGVLTTRGYFHVFRSQGDVVRGAPETSVFLPRARVALGRDGTLQITSGGRFSRCRVVIQDGSASLDNWHLLMQDICCRAPVLSPPPPPAGLATPPDSSADEASSPVRRTPRTREARRRHQHRQTLLALSPDPAPERSVAETPTRIGRPFSADASMLGQTPTQFAPPSQCTAFTPTQDIYMRPLAATPVQDAYAGRLSVPPAQDPYAGRLSAPPAQDPYARSPSVPPPHGALEAYSPDFSDVPGGSSDSSGLQAAAAAGRGPSSSGASGRADSLFERSISPDSESAPISSLPQLHCPPQQPRCFHEPFPSSPSPAGPRAPRQFSSSTGVMPAARGYSPDIWRADLLAVPDPAMRISSGLRQRPRSMICGDADAALDPHNPYLGEFLARRQARCPRAASHSEVVGGGGSSTGQRPDPQHGRFVPGLL